MKTKPRVTGIGGIFMRAKSPKVLAAWYRRHLGLPVDDQWFGCSFDWRDAKKPQRKGCTAWSLFASDTKYLGSPRQGHMVNYRVANLKKVIAALKKERVWIDPKGIEKSDFGKFAWIKDGEGNRIELWEPPKGM
ncbi:MAG TPA: VOC family protein [Lacunisphaera sp.]|nr:VOC family protein [Lacunisphaera sp.]